MGHFKQAIGIFCALGVIGASMDSASALSIRITPVWPKAEYQKSFDKPMKPSKPFRTKPDPSESSRQPSPLDKWMGHGWWKY